MREPVKGKTDAGRRREARARATRDRVVAAATALFLERGYASTTVEAIAAEARVAPATVYQAFGTKAAILARALDHSVVGDPEPVALLDRPWVATARRERDPRARLAAVVTGASEVAVRTAALKEVMRDAAATEPVIRDLLHEDARRRLATQRELLRIALGRDPDDDEAAVFYALVDSWSYLSAARHLGWTPTRWRRWLLDVVERQLREPRPPHGGG